MDLYTLPAGTGPEAGTQTGQVTSSFRPHTHTRTHKTPTHTDTNTNKQRLRVFKLWEENGALDENLHGHKKNSQISKCAGSMNVNI